MSTYNGAKYIREQLNSIISQTGVEVNILVRDDGSKDNTIDILEEYSKKGLLEYYIGENIGYGKSFLHLITQSGNADYYAFADQDDVWEYDKLSSAVYNLDSYDAKKPLLYASALTFVDSELNFLKEKNFNNLKLTLGSALVRQRLAGCTMVFNKTLRDYCTKCYESTNSRFGHDGWAYLLCLATGGNVIYDPVSRIKFRRHGANKTVSGNGVRTRIKREFSKFSTLKDTQYNASKLILDNFSDQLTNSAVTELTKVVEYKDTIGKTLKLAINKEFRCGVFFVDFLNKLFIFSRCF
jgi:glycosyltransferase involved in cell wall biosynthesis